MNYRENNHSAINRAMNRLEDVHQYKKDESESAKAAASSPAALFGSLALPSLLQVESILKSSQKTFGVMAEKLNSRFKTQPWGTLAKVAVGALVVGIIIGHRTRRPSKIKVRE